jgi:hypothetical protein
MWHSRVHSRMTLLGLHHVGRGLAFLGHITKALSHFGVIP